MAPLGIVCYADPVGAAWHPEMPGSSRDIISSNVTIGFKDPVFRSLTFVTEIDLLYLFLIQFKDATV